METTARRYNMTLHRELFPVDAVDRFYMLNFVQHSRHYTYTVMTDSVHICTMLHPQL